VSTDDKAYSLEQRLNAQIGLIYADGANQESIGTATNGVDLQLYDYTGTPGAPTSGCKLYSTGGLLFVVSEDGNKYATEHVILKSLTDLNVTSAVQATVPNLSIAVAAGSYKFEAWVPVTGPGTNTDQIFLSFGGPTTSSFAAWINYEGGFASSDTVRTQSAIGVNTGAGSPATAAASRAYVGDLRGFATFTASGTLTTSVASSAAGGTRFTTKVGGMMKIYPS
jgi:hypothetical protein